MIFSNLRSVSLSEIAETNGARFRSRRKTPKLELSTLVFPRVVYSAISVQKADAFALSYSLQASQTLGREYHNSIDKKMNIF